MLGGLGLLLLMLKIYGLCFDLVVMLGVLLFWIKLVFFIILVVGVMLVL